VNAEKCPKQDEMPNANVKNTQILYARLKKSLKKWNDAAEENNALEMNTRNANNAMK